MSLSTSNAIVGITGAPLAGGTALATQDYADKAAGAVSGAIVSVSTSRSLAATDYDQTLNVTANVTLTGVSLAPGRRIYGVIVGAFILTFAGTAVNANGATQCAGDGAMFSIVIDGNGRPCWSSNRLA